MLKKSLLTVISLLFLSLTATVGAYWWINAGRAIDSNDKITYEFVVPKGQSVTEIASRLKLAGLIRTPLYFKVIVNFNLDLKGKLQAGSFKLSKSQTPKQIASILTKGSDDQQVTLIEGLRQEEIYLKLVDQGIAVDSASWLEQVKGQQIEGKLFPDTYFIPKTSNSAQVIKILTTNFNKKVIQPFQNDVSLTGLDLNQTLTVASLVEREARYSADRSIIAGIILKRWRAGWALQIDATVQYAVATRRCLPLINNNSAINCDWWPKTLTNNDLAINSPYNTYRQAGLPPTPIGNPGLSSIKAVLNPTITDYWFYLTGKDGQMHYATTNDEHNINIRKYL